MLFSRKLWQLTDAKSDDKKIVNGRTYWRHKSTGYWWSNDTAGHGWCVYKVYKEGSSGQLIWHKDADEFGDFIVNKHKGPIGKIINYEIKEANND